jgi:hypothetical protein
MFGMWWYYQRVIIAFLIWTAVWGYFFVTRKYRFSLKALFVILTGYAVLAALAGGFIRGWTAYTGQP